MNETVKTQICNIYSKSGIDIYSIDYTADINQS